MPGPFLPLVRSGIESRVKALEDLYNEVLRRLGNVENKANRLDAQAQHAGPLLPQTGGGGSDSGSYWATTSGSISGKSGSGPGVGTGSVEVVDDSLNFTGVGTRTILNGYSGSTESGAWVRVVPTDLKDGDGNTIFDIIGEDCPGGGG